MVLTAGIEAGGTTFVVSLAKDSPDNVVDRASFPTSSDPAKMMQMCVDWIKQSKERPEALGIATFGPICLQKNSEHYGKIHKSPKTGWSYFEMFKFVKAAFPDIPIGIDTDVNGAAIAELVHGVGRGSDMSSLVYITIGTGIGVGILNNRTALIGMSHSEAGHIRVQRHSDDTFEGVCPFHKDCVEGLASATAISARCRIHESNLPDLDDSSPVWDLVGFYLGQLCANLFLTVSPECIVLGGGVSKRRVILPSVKKHFDQTMSGYMHYPESLIQLSELDVGAGVIGSHLLALQTMNEGSLRL